MKALSFNWLALACHKCIVSKNAIQSNRVASNTEPMVSAVERSSDFSHGTYRSWVSYALAFKAISQGGAPFASCCPQIPLIREVLSNGYDTEVGRRQWPPEAYPTLPSLPVSRSQSSGNDLRKQQPYHRRFCEVPHLRQTITTPGARRIDLVRCIYVGAKNRNCNYSCHL